MTEFELQLIALKPGDHILSGGRLYLEVREDDDQVFLFWYEGWTPEADVVSPNISLLVNSRGQGISHSGTDDPLPPESVIMARFKSLLAEAVNLL